ncbi:SprT family protein [Streptococcus sp. DD13]|uniref:SprT family protein n=1 Tax=Streptococcus sp. DD13 TaxID=1777881 RepID=UPI000793E677|nr:SprT family protein [Streptococcus sp. DD13]KXT78461.1 putative metallopeptidase (Zinc) SprT family [Streptococcus sp. DD13]
MNLTDYVRQVSREDFGKEFHHEAVWNKRLRTTGGRFFPRDGHLDFNPTLFEEFGEEVFRGIVRHELCHYHLFFERKGYKHRDRDFQNLLKQVGGLRYTPKSLKAPSPYLYQCVHCGLTYQRKRKIKTDQYRCGRCHARIQLLSSPS